MATQFGQQFPDYYNYAGLPITAANSNGTGSRTITNNTPDPWRDFLLNTVLSKYSTTGEVPDFTKAAIQAFTSNPGIAGQFFPSIAQPLVAALEPQFRNEQTQLNDAFRKAGGTGAGTLQAGSYAQAERQLLNDQGQRRDTLLAQNYVPLTNQISTNFNNAIQAGLELPQATAKSIAPLLGTASSLAPLSTSSETGTINPAYDATKVLQIQQAAADSSRNYWNNWWNSNA